MKDRRINSLAKTNDQYPLWKRKTVSEGIKYMTYFNGGTVLFAAGLMPLSSAFRACIMKCLVGEREATVQTKLPEKKEGQIRKLSAVNEALCRL